MSGICGIVRLDGGKPEAAEIAGMTDVLERRGPDGTGTWQSGSAALGHTLLATTPEALVERLPLNDATSGCTITADARLDNREELLAALDLAGETRVIGDGELILRAYLRWGEDCPKLLLGDFAFAIWDERQGQLFCARDHMGMRQLHYHHDLGWGVAFATEAEAVLAHSAVPKLLNEGRLADFLDGLEGLDPESTFFDGVLRLPPGHFLRVSSQAAVLRRYWQLVVPPTLELPSDEAYAAAFLDVFKQAVSCRLRSPGPVGAMVSGGLDSSSAAVVAASLAEAGSVHSYSVLGPDPGNCRETRAIHSILSQRNFAATTINFTDLQADREELVAAVEDVADPFDAQMNLVRAIYRSAHRQGIKVVLDGVGGDLALSSGNRIGQLIRGLRFRQAMTEAKQEAEFWGFQRSAARLLIGASWAALVPLPLRRFKQRTQAWWSDRRALAGRSRLSPAFARRSSLVERRRSYRSHLAPSPIDRTYALLGLTHPHTAAARERYDRIASRFAVEPRDPFLDIRMLRFCLSLPAEQLQSAGWTKLVLRRAMEALLPNDVVWRRGKDHLGLEATKALIAGNDRWKDLWLQEANRVELLTSIRADGDLAMRDPKNFIELFSLACWLSRHDV